MKKFFAILCALLVPTAHTYAWVGGPFSNNNLTPEGDDGIYEAIAFPAPVLAPAVTFNGIGLYRWAVQNRNPNAGTIRIAPFTGNASNVQFNGFLGASSEHVWFINGAVYYGVCFGSVNSMAGHVSCVGNAAAASPVVPGIGGFGVPGLTVTGTVTGQFANSFFTAGMRKYGQFVATRNFDGAGTVSVSPNPTAAAPVVDSFPILVFGTRVNMNPRG